MTVFLAIISQLQHTDRLARDVAAERLELKQKPNKIASKNTIFDKNAQY